MQVLVRHHGVMCKKGENVKTLLLLLLSVTLITLSGCSDPKIDTSSDESMKASIEKVRQSLPQEKKKVFDEAIQVLAMSQLNLKDLFTQGAAGVSNTEIKMKESISGKTGSEVIAEAERVKQERKEKERIQALDEIKELEGKRVKAQIARSELTKFEVVRSRYYKRKREYTGEQPIIELTVKNNTTHAVSRAYFIGTLASPNRAVPWLKEEFNYQIAGGLEPGEEANWSLAPNMFSDWGTVKAPEDAILTVEVQRLDGPDGEALFSTRDFSDDDGKRLDKLKQEYGG